MNVVVVSDFNADLVARYLSADSSEPVCTGTAAPYGQVFQTLVLDTSGTSSDQVSLVWTRPEGVVPEFANVLDASPVDVDALLSGVDQFAAAIRAHASSRKLVLVASWVPSQMGRGLGMLDWTPNGRASCLARMNIALADALAPAKNVFVLDAQHWLDVARPARDAKYWFSAKCPFTDVTCRAAARDVKAAIRGLTGKARKLIVVDLDDTLWGGIVGDDGWQALRLGGHDIVGEAHLDFQASLKALSRRGVAIAVASKNDEAVALEAFDKHPEMLLRRADLAGWRINWNDKARNIVELAEELNLGLDSIVFIDDNVAERGRVREALPEVLVPDWPQDPARYGEALRELDCFDTGALTAEDRTRALMYAQGRERRESMAVSSSTDEWLKSLGVRVKVESIDERNIKRSVQLANKTNQMNLRTRRFTESELEQWLAEAPTRGAAAITVADRFGDLGLTGLVSWEQVDENLEIVDFILSCRAMGRRVENIMAHLVVDVARRGNQQSVVARLVPTPRNAPCLAFWQESGFTEAEPNTFVWNPASPYPVPESLTIRTDPDTQLTLQP